MVSLLSIVGSGSILPCRSHESYVVVMAIYFIEKYSRAQPYQFVNLYHGEYKEEL